MWILENAELFVRILSIPTCTPTRYFITWSASNFSILPGGILYGLLLFWHDGYDMTLLTRFGAKAHIITFADKFVCYATYSVCLYIVTDSVNEPSQSMIQCYTVIPGLSMNTVWMSHSWNCTQSQHIGEVFKQ